MKGNPTRIVLMNSKVENLSNAVSSGAAQARDKASDTLDSARHAVDQAADRGKELASDAAKVARQKSSELADTATGLAAELQAMTRQNPLMTVIGAAFVGVLIGMMARGHRE